MSGSNKGIGFSIVKGLCQRYDGIVYLTSRDEQRGKAAVKELNKLGLFPEYHQLDVADEASIINFRDYIRDKHGGIDILINNAAVISSLLKHSYEEDKMLIDINYKSVLTIQKVIFPLVRENGRILHISSDAGHLSNVRNKYWIERLSRDNLRVEDVNEFVDWYLESSKNGTFDKNDLADNGSIAAYRVSKVALSALTKIQQKLLEFRNISVNSMYPGLVRTGMTVGIGFLSPDQAAETPIYLVLDAPQSLKGQYVWYDRKIIDWYDYGLDIYFTTALANNWILYSIFINIKNYIFSFFKWW